MRPGLESHDRAGAFLHLPPFTDIILCMREMTDYELGWVAGLLEGEGSFMAKGGWKPEIRATMSDEDAIRRLYQFTGCGGVWGPFAKYFNGRRVKDCWVWSVQAQQDSIALMHLLHPHMGVRRQEQIDATLAAKAAHKPPRPGKLTEEQVKTIRSEYNGVRFRHGQAAELAVRFGVGVSTINYVAKGKTWKES